MTRKLCAFLIAAICTSVAHAQYPYQIDDYDVAMNLHKDGWMDVKETLQVTFNDFRHGIFRNIPIDLPTGRGTTRRILITGARVDDPAGNSYETKISRQGINLNIRIGDPKTQLEPGAHKTYIIRYKVFGMLNWFDDDQSWEPSVELYWNAVGTEWDTSIGHTTFHIQMPPVERKHMRARMLLGAYGATEATTLGERPQSGSQSIYKLTFSDSELRGEVTKTLQPGEGVTVVLDLPAKTIDKPGFWDTIKLFLLPNLGFIIPLIVLAAMLPLWMMSGRDPAGGPMVVQFEPPDGMTGPEVGTMIDETVDKRDLAAGIISLAVKGFVEIFPQEEGLIFKKRTAEMQVTDKSDEGDLTYFEAGLLHRLKEAPSGRISDTDLRTYVAPHIPKLRQDLYDSLVTRGYYLANPDTARTIWLVAGLVVVGLLAFIFHWISPTREVLPSIIGGALGAILVYIFSRGMPKRTPDGSKARMKVIGFAEFIRRARGDELNWMSKKHPDQSLFEEYLPHAVAFGLTKEWAEAFRNIDLQMPSWYHSGYTGMWNPIWFASDLSSVSDTVSTAAMTPPRSSGGSGGFSGFGGGGFSGGGFGGGGGGSW